MILETKEFLDKCSERTHETVNRCLLPARSIELRIVRSREEMEIVHSLRERRLFQKYHPVGTPNWVPYDPMHPDGKDPRKLTLVLYRDGEIQATARLDFEGMGCGTIRLVATAETALPGTGRLLMEKIQSLSRAVGLKELRLNAQSTVVGFYEKLGWKPAEWQGSSRDIRSIPMKISLVKNQ